MPSLAMYRPDKDTVMVKYNNDWYEIHWPEDSKFEFHDHSLESFVRMGGHRVSPPQTTPFKNNELNF